MFKRSEELSLDCYVDADFSGLWISEDILDPISVRSRTGYVITLGNFTVFWSSKLQSEIEVSTLEAEYISMSISMRELIPFKSLFK